jgi:hypothetical protein
VYILLEMTHLRVGFFTHSPTEIAFSFYRDSMRSADYFRFLERIEEAAQCDVLLVMQHDDDRESLAGFRKRHPEVLTGIVDPRGAHVLDSLENTDFFVVDSLEKRDYFVGFGRPVFLYHDVLHLPHQTKKHRNSDRFVIGYHGNRVHLEAMFPTVTTAIEKLAEELHVEFWAIYNHAHLGKWTWTPKNVTVRHLQWDQAQIPEYLAHMDVGVSPNAMVLANPARARRALGIFSNFFHEKPEDFLIRFKVPTNPGRIYVFANASIPVVSDIAPSAMRWIEPGISGEIAHHSGAWYHALRRLARAPELRERYAERLWAKMEPDFSPENQNVDFLRFAADLVERGREASRTPVILHAELGRLRSSRMRWNFRFAFWRKKTVDFAVRVRRKVFDS